MKNKTKKITLFKGFYTEGCENQYRVEFEIYMEEKQEESLDLFSDEKITCYQLKIDAITYEDGEIWSKTGQHSFPDMKRYACENRACEEAAYYLFKKNVNISRLF